MVLCAMILYDTGKINKLSNFALYKDGSESILIKDVQIGMIQCAWIPTI